MKKFIIFLASIVTILLVAAILIPIIFKEDIQMGMKKILDDSIEAQVYFEPSKFGLTLFKNFPNPTASIEDFGIVGLNQFEGDTLLSVESFNITINLFSLFSDVYTIRSINLIKPRINIIILKNGNANYEIVKETENTPGEEENTSNFNLSIDQWNFTDGRISYSDETLDFFILLDGFNHSGSGDISLDIYDLSTSTIVDKATVSYEGTKYLNGQSISADAKININIPEFKFTFRDNAIRVNDFPVSFEGYFAMPDEDMEMDISFASTNSSIKSLYSLIPGVYTESFDNIKAEGEMTFSGFVKGTYNDQSMPAYQVKLKATNGSISYSNLPTPITNINLDMEVDCKDGNTDNTRIEIKQMKMDMGTNPFEGSLLVRNLIDYSMKAELNAKLNLGELSSMFPIEGTDMKGVFSLNVKADGIYDSIRNVLPAITASMYMEDGFIKSSEFPTPLEKVSFVAAVDGSSGKMQDFVVKVDDFSMTMGGEELTGHLLLNNLVDYNWDLFLKGNLDLEVISEIYPIDDLKYSGILSADIETEGKYSDVVAERYDQFPTEGKFQLSNFSFTSSDLPQGMKIGESTVIMNPRNLKVESFSGTIGKSDLEINGLVTNYIDFIFQETALIHGKMKLNSNVIDINEWISSDETSVESEEEMKMEVLEIPRNFDFEFESTIKSIYYDNLHLQNATGLLTIRDGVLDMSDLSFDLLGGAIVMNGKYDTRIIDTPAFDYKLNIKSLSIPQAFTSFTTVQTFVPMARHMSGNFSTNFNISGLLKKDMTPVFESLNGKGLIQIADAFVKESKLVSGISGFMKSDMKSDQLSLKDVIMKTSLENGRAHVAPFDLTLGNQKANVSGSIGADGTLDYFLSTEVEAGIVGQQVNELLATIGGQNNTPPSSKIKLNFNISGTYDKPKILLAGTTSTDGKTTTVKEAVKQEIDSQVEATKKEVEKKVQDETEELMEKGEEQLQQQLDTLKKELTKDLKDEAGEVLGKQLDSTTNELKKSLENIFKKKKKNR